MTPVLTADERFTLAEKIVRLFRVERFTYLAISIVTSVVLIWVGYQAVSQPGANKSVAGLLFGSAGIVTASIARLLTIFNKVFKVVLGA